MIVSFWEYDNWGRKKASDGNTSMEENIKNDTRQTSDLPYKTDFTSFLQLCMIKDGVDSSREDPTTSFVWNCYYSLC